MGINCGGCNRKINDNEVKLNTYRLRELERKFSSQKYQPHIIKIQSVFKGILLREKIKEKFKFQLLQIKNSKETSTQKYSYITKVDMKQIFERMLGNDSGVRIDLIKYSPSEEDATGMKFCAII